MTATDSDTGLTMEVISAVSLFDGAPFIVLGWGDMRAQMSPLEARDLARNVMRAAEGAENDAALVNVLRRSRVPDEVAVGLLGELRAERGE